MAGLSSQTFGSTSCVERKQFIGQYKDSDLGLELYGFQFRTHDPQLGRFIQIDPLSEKFLHNSTYAYAENRPIDGIDLEGLEYFRAGECLIRLSIIYDHKAKEVYGAQVTFNLDNVSGATKEAVSRSKNNSGIVVGHLYYDRNMKKATDAEMTDITNMPSLIGQQDASTVRIPATSRQNGKTSKASGTKLPLINTSSGQNRGDIFLMAINFISDLAVKRIGDAIDTDIMNASRQAINTAPILSDLSLAISNNLIPEKNLNQSFLTHFANYLLSGEKPIKEFYTTEKGVVKGRVDREQLHMFENIIEKINGIKSRQ